MADSEEENKQAKIAALRHLRDQNFYEPKTDNPEGLDLDAPARTPDQAANALNAPALNANPLGQVQPSTQAPTPAIGQPGALNPEQTMQMDPTNLKRALTDQDRQKLLQDLVNAARQ